MRSEQPRPKPSICFVAPKAYPVLSNQHELGEIGGAEVQQVLIARALLQRGYQVKFVTLDHGQPDGIEHNGISIFKTYRPEAGWPGIRFLHPRWTHLCAACKRASADIYYQRSAGAETGQLAIWCHWHRRPMIFASASDSNCQASLPDLRTRREKKLYLCGLRLATRVVTQTEQQAGSLRSAFGRKSTVIRSCCTLPPRPNRQSPTVNEDRARILWIGRPSAKKRFQWVISLAAAHPKLLFDVVGNMGDRHDGERGLPPNVILHGQVACSAVDRFYKRATLLLCTSHTEGFPNTFLEAWARGLPVVSTVDPDGVISRVRLGEVADTLEGLGRAVNRLIRSPEAWLGCSARAWEHCRTHHSLERVVSAYEELILGMWSASNANCPQNSCDGTVGVTGVLSPRE